MNRSVYIFLLVVILATTTVIAAPTTPTSLLCNGGSCNTTFTTPITLNCSGSNVSSYQLFYGNSTPVTTYLPSIGTWNSTNQSGKTTWSNSGFYNTSIRIEIQPAYIKTNGNYNISLKFVGATDTAVDVRNVSICEKVSQGVCGAMTYLSFKGKNSVIISTSSFNWTDQLTYNIDNTKTYYITFMIGTGATTGLAYKDDTHIVHLRAQHKDYSMVQDWNALGIGVQETIYNLDQINITNTSSTQQTMYTYIANQTTSPILWNITNLTGNVIESMRCFAYDTTTKSANYTITTNLTLSTTLLTAPTSLTCNGGSCNTTFTGEITLNCSGGSGYDNYSIDVGNSTGTGLEPTTMITSWNSTSQSADSWSDSSRTNESFRIRINKSNIIQQGNYNISIQFKAGSDNSLHIFNPTICVYESAGNCVAGTWVNLTIAGNHSKATLASGSTVWTDQLTYNLSNTNDYYISFKIGTTGGDGVAYKDDPISWHYRTGSQVVDWSTVEDGWDTFGTNPTIYSVDAIKVSNATYSNVISFIPIAIGIPIGTVIGWDPSEWDGEVFESMRCSAYSGVNTANYTIATNLTIATAISDTVSPFYLYNSTNTIIAGQSISHNLYWQDNINLSGYIFSSCNGTACYPPQLDKIVLLQMDDTQAYWNFGTADALARAINGVGVNLNAEVIAEDLNATTTYKAGIRYWSANLSYVEIIQGSYNHSSSCNQNYVQASTDINLSQWHFTAAGIPIPNGFLPANCYANTTLLDALRDEGYLFVQDYGITSDIRDGITEKPLTIWNGTEISDPDWLWSESQIQAEIDKQLATRDHAIIAIHMQDYGDINYTKIAELNATLLSLKNKGYRFMKATDFYNYKVNQGNWKNHTWQPLSSNASWANVSVVRNNSIETYHWCMYANDTSNNWNVSSCYAPFSYTTKYSNTCTYSGSGDWYINCADGCNITTNINLGGNKLHINGTGLMIINNAVLFGFSSAKVEGISTTQRCTLRCIGSRCFSK